MKTYKQLTYEQRCQIECLKKSGHSQIEIARLVECSQATVSREIRRNAGQRGYRHKQAQRISEERRYRQNRFSKMDSSMVSYVENQLMERHSPEQISGRLKREGKPSVSPERIYQHIKANRRAGGLLHTYCRRKGRRHNRGYKSSGRGQIPNRVGIEQRPAVVDEKRRVGDWEIDTVIGAGHKGVLVTVVERKTQFTVARFSESKRAADVTAAAVLALAPYRAAVKTITADNGKEFAWHEVLAECLGAEVYFARPYHAWERGLNENTNGLLRQYWPKGMALDKVSQEECKHVIEQLNNRPRKTLHFDSPMERMTAYLAEIR